MGENMPLQFVPVEDPNYDRLPWANNEKAWAVRGFFTPIIIGTLIALIWTYCGAKKDRKDINDKGRVTNTRYSSTDEYRRGNSESVYTSNSSEQLELQQTVEMEERD